MKDLNRFSMFAGLFLGCFLILSACSDSMYLSPEEQAREDAMWEEMKK